MAFGVTTVFAFTDPHGKTRHAEAVILALETRDVDGIVASGDLTYFGMMEPKFCEKLKSLNRPIYCIPGNHESDEQMQELKLWNKFWIDVSYRIVDAGAFLIGGIPGTSEWWADRKVDWEVVSQTVLLLDPPHRDKPFILLVHISPSGCGIDGIRHGSPDSGGSATAREVILRLKPDLVVTGHYHQDFGQMGYLSGIQIQNPGPNGSFIDIPEAQVKR